MITRRTTLAAILVGSGLAASRRAPARAGESAPIRLGVLKFGTVSWELDTIAHHGLDARHGVAVETVFFAGEDATNVALQASAVDIIVTDWLWVSRQRSAGSDLTLVPYSTAVGAIMVPQASPIATLADLKGLKLGVAGGALDKSWLLIRALAMRRHGIDLLTANDIAYGAPPLLMEKAIEGELDAVLNFWHFCARLEAEGFRRLFGANQAAAALGAEGDVAALGYVFREALPAGDPQALRGFLQASADAKALLVASDAEWLRLAPVIRAEGAELEKLRDRYREGVPHRPIAAEAADAAKLYAVLAEIGGESLVGAAAAMAPGTFWQGAAG